MKDEKYLIFNGTYHGDNLVWWGKNSCGYTSRLDEAGRYSKTEAEDICRRDSEGLTLAFPESHVEEEATRVVMQRDIDWAEELKIEKP